MTIRTYQDQNASFGQTTCRICLEEYRATDTVYELGCRHLFHTNCLREDYIRCPICLQDIAERIHIYSEDEVKSIVKRLFKAAHRLVQSIPRNGGRSQLEILNLLREPSGSASQQNTAIEQYRQLAEELNAIASLSSENETVFQKKLTEFKSKILDQCEHIHLSLEDDTQFERITEKRILQAYVESLLSRLKIDPVTTCYCLWDLYAQRIPEPLTQFTKTLTEHLKEDADIRAAFDTREEQYARIHETAMRNLSFMEKVKHFSKLDSIQTEVITRHHPNFKWIAPIAQLYRHKWKAAAVLSFVLFYSNLREKMELRSYTIPEN